MLSPILKLCNNNEYSNIYMWMYITSFLEIVVRINNKSYGLYLINYLLHDQTTIYSNLIYILKIIKYSTFKYYLCNEEIFQTFFLGF